MVARAAEVERPIKVPVFDRTWWAFGRAPWSSAEFLDASAWQEYPAKS